MSTQEAPMERPLIQLPSGVVVDIAKIAFIARKEIGQYLIVFENTGMGPNIDQRDMDVLLQYGIVQKLVEAEQPAAANDAKIEISK